MLSRWIAIPNAASLSLFKCNVSHNTTLKSVSTFTDIWHIGQSDDKCKTFDKVTILKQEASIQYSCKYHVKTCLNSQCYTPDAICRWTFSISSRSSRFCRMCTTTYDNAPTTAMMNSNNQKCCSSSRPDRRQLKHYHRQTHVSCMSWLQ